MKITSRRGAGDSARHVPKEGNANGKRKDMLILLGIGKLQVKQQGMILLSQVDTQKEVIEPSPGMEQKTPDHMLPWSFGKIPGITHQKL